jgi:hypothetical protein
VKQRQPQGRETTMSEPDIKELLESPCEWTDYSCEAICHMALDEIERLRDLLKDADETITELEYHDE